VTNPLGSVTSRVASLMLQSCPQSAGLLAWWPGDGDFQDRINGFDGVSAGTVTFAPAEVGQGFHLVNSAISASGGFDFSAANALTIELWFKLNALKNYNGLVSAQNCCSYRLMVDPGRHLFYDPGTHTDTSVGPVLNLGQFYHVALVIVGGGSASLYLDGQVIHASSNGVPAVLPPVSTFLLGAGENSGTWTMEDGIIDEISIYGRPLSAAEVAALHAAGRSGKCAVELPAPVAVIGETVNGTLQILSPVVTDGRFSFSFQSSDGRSYIVEQKDDLSTSGWTLYTNLAGNGSLIEVNAPLTNVPQRYFRVRAP